MGLRNVLWMIRHPLSSPPPTDEELAAELSADEGEPVNDPWSEGEPEHDTDAPASPLAEDLGPR